MTAPAFVTTAAADLAGWAALFSPRGLPVLSGTAETLAELRADEDNADAHSLAEALSGDPLFTLKLLAHVGELRSHRAREAGGDAETVTEALVMLGIPPFFRAFEQLSTVDEWLAGRAEAQQGFARVLARSHRAARFATGFAVHRMDHDVAVIGEAALLHDFAELLLWLRAPDLAAEMARRQAADTTLRSAAVQRAVLHVELPALQHELMLRWRLPELLVNITNDNPARRHRDAHQVRNVLLAIRVARHSADGWSNPALPDDAAEIATLLNLASEPTWRLLHEIDAS